MTSFEQETQNTWNKVAALYQEKFMDLDYYNESYDAFSAAVVQPNASVLDIGCGPGNITRYLLSKRPDYQIHGIDLSPNMIALAQELNPTASFEVLDSRSLLQLTTQYHAMISGFCIPYLSATETDQLITAAATRLLEKGILYLSFVEGDPAATGFRTGSTGDRTYFYYHRTADISQGLTQNGFQIIKQMEINYPLSDGSTEQHCILIAQKK